VYWMQGTLSPWYSRSGAASTDSDFLFHGAKSLLKGDPRPRSYTKNELDQVSQYLDANKCQWVVSESRITTNNNDSSIRSEARQESTRCAKLRRLRHLFPHYHRNSLHNAQSKPKTPSPSSSILRKRILEQWYSNLGLDNQKYIQHNETTEDTFIQDYRRHVPRTDGNRRSIFYSKYHLLRAGFQCNPLCAL
jgi:hypothetical protein